MKRQLLLTALMITGLVYGLASWGLKEVSAHCDTLAGPVIADALVALERGDVTPVLKWVKVQAEPEIKLAFQAALSDRKANKDAADMKFFETLVRVHREGEGEKFTGIKPADQVEPMITAADQALASGSVDTLTEEITKHLAAEIQARFERAVECRKHKDESVQKGRDFVEAYVQYVHYVESIHMALTNESAHHEGAAGH